MRFLALALILSSATAAFAANPVTEPTKLPPEWQAKSRALFETAIEIPTVAGRGNHGPGGNGDLYVHIEMQPHPELRREQEHLIYTAPIGFARAVLGGQVTVPTLDGPQTVEVKAGTQHGELHRLRGQGMPRLQGSGMGDLIV